MKVCEIFASIQGESSFAGYPCVFIRLTGCNLRCTYCDTTYAYEEGTDMEISDLVKRVTAFDIDLVEVTGGEPLLQDDVHELIDRLLTAGKNVLLETNGSVSIEGIDDRVSIVLDIKTPSSGMSERMIMGNLDHLRKKDDVKFVISDKGDYEWAIEMISSYDLYGRCNVLLSPAHGSLEPSMLSKWMVEDRSKARLNLQLHKVIYGDDARGV